MFDSIRPAPENRLRALVVILGLAIAAFAYAKFGLSPEFFDAFFYHIIIWGPFFLLVIIVALCFPTPDETDLARRNGWKKAVKLISPKLKYDHDKKFDPKKLRAEFGLDRPVTNLESTGKFRAPEYHFHFIKAEDHEPNKFPDLVFEGLVGSLALKRQLTGRTLISPDLIEAKTGMDLPRLLSTHKFPGEDLKPVRLENHLFEKLYRVQATNVVEARTILTPLAMEGLIQFKERFQVLPNIAVSGNSVEVRIAGPRPHEHIKLDGQLKDLDGYIKSLKTACEALDYLKAILK